MTINHEPWEHEVSCTMYTVHSFSCRNFLTFLGFGHGLKFVDLKSSFQCYIYKKLTKNKTKVKD